MRVDYRNDTVRDRIAQAFRGLRKEGYAARMNFSCCQSCGAYELNEKSPGRYVFFHRQDADGLERPVNPTNPLYLAWAGDGQEIVRFLLGAGLVVSWDGSEQHRIAVTGITS